MQFSLFIFGYIFLWQCSTWSLCKSTATAEPIMCIEMTTYHNTCHPATKSHSTSPFEYRHLLHDMPRLCIEDSHFRELETFSTASFCIEKKWTVCLPEDSYRRRCCIVCIITLPPTNMIPLQRHRASLQLALVLD